LQHPCCRCGHAVDAPVGVAVLVADGDGEPAVVGPDHLKSKFFINKCNNPCPGE